MLVLSPLHVKTEDTDMQSCILKSEHCRDVEGAIPTNQIWTSLGKLFRVGAVMRQ